MNDIKAREAKAFKVHKLPTELHDQERLSERFWLGQQINATVRQEAEMRGMLGNRFYLN